VILFEFRHNLWHQSPGAIVWHCLRDSTFSHFEYRSVTDTHPDGQTDRQTDRRTDTQRWHIPHLAYRRAVIKY